MKVPRVRWEAVDADQAGSGQVGKITAIIRSLEEERFFSVLDVALDIQSEIDFGSAR